MIVEDSEVYDVIVIASNMLRKMLLAGSDSIGKVMYRIRHAFFYFLYFSLQVNQKPVSLPEDKIYIVIPNDKTITCLLSLLSKAIQGYY